MKYLFENIDEVLKEIGRHKKTALVFDFDGTLATIADTPELTFIEDSTRDLLGELHKHFYVVILSGREIHDLMEKVGIEDLHYSGNHGVEWKFRGEEYGKIDIPEDYLKKLSDVKKVFVDLSNNYKGTNVYDKHFSVTLHYRLIEEKDKSNFLKDLKKTTSQIERDGGIEIVKGEKDIDARPAINWNKGYFVKFLEEKLKKEFKTNPLILYAGDSSTDEDVFRVLKEGITIRVGENQKSAAEYFINNIEELNKFLKKMIELTLHPRVNSFK